MKLSKLFLLVLTLAVVTLGLNNNTATPKQLNDASGATDDYQGSTPGAFRAKGNWLGCLMKGTDEEAGAAWPDPLNQTPKSARAPWSGELSELGSWGWSEGEMDQNISGDFTDGSRGNAHHIETALRALGLRTLPETRGGNNRGLYIEHGEMDPKTVDYGDVEYQTYKVNSHEYHNLHYYIANNVINTDTLPLVASILQAKGVKDVPRWPGIEVSTSEPEGQALLGSPIGVSLAFLLIQHKAGLGIKHVTSVTIFRDNRGFHIPEIELLFKIENYVAPQLQRRDTVDHVQHSSHVQVPDNGKSSLRVHEFRLGAGQLKARL
ncbi:hypothetical protein CC86DRAFT_407782 [Ophiobolus disseminans]|uniref:Uncharacterized protein n=1 Tax=Ophiobolus disseminans TaxID=1469910 RepID=A0A6A6ZWB4_9PLEO|nr:hypothetical protein CC86DRAFT_407782 [Ophiobolus disseminans]